MRKKILLAVGGTGGHLFPAQALARDLKGSYEILFGGARLGANPFFEKEEFSHREIKGSSPFRGNPLKAVFELSKGVRESLKLLSEFSPDLLIGFGSFYSFPLLAAARLKKIPYLLVESNALPGKVNRLFSSKALFSAIQFEEAATHLKGKSTLTKMPLWAKSDEKITQEEAKASFGLDSNVFTLLVLGGSQGSRVINEAVHSLQLKIPYQVIHLHGKKEDFAFSYEERGIRASLKPFEKKMHLAWQAADLAICRSGAGTLTEIVNFEVPSILVPWPGASEDHQLKNAYSFAKSGGVYVLKEEEIGRLEKTVENAIKNIEEMREKLKKANHLYNSKRLDQLVKMFLEEME